MIRFSAITALLFFTGAAASSAPVLDGVRDASYGSAAAVQSVETGFGDNFSELNAAYARVDGGTLFLMLTGNLESNFNKLNIFFDSRAGGQNVLQNDGNFGGNNPENDGWAAKHAGMTFDAGFEADYLLTLRNGFFGGARFDIDYAVIGGGLGNYVTGPDIFGGALTGSNASALANGIGVAFNNSNAAGIGGGNGAPADQTAAQAVATGIELAIPLAAIGNPVGAFTISAMINGSNHDYLSNQFLGGLPAGTSNLGGDGTGLYNGSVSQINLNNFAGNQYFRVVAAPAPVPEPASLLLVSGPLSFLFWRRRRG